MTEPTATSGRNDLLITFDEGFLRNPYESWRQLREQGPVHQAMTPDGSPIWLVVGDEHVRALAADRRLTVDRSYSRHGYTGFSLPPELDRNLLNMDGTDHRRIRRQVAAGFTPARITAIKPIVQDAAATLAGELHVELHKNGSADLMSAYASPYALKVITSLLGIPESVLPQFRSWTDELLAPSSPAAAKAAVRDVYDYVISVVARLREAPGDSFLGGLVSVSDTEDPDQLSCTELTSVVFLLLFAGYENVFRAIGSGLIAAADATGGLSVLRDALMESDSRCRAIDELLRYDPPPQLAIRRFAVEDIEVGSTVIPRGDTVMLSWASANRDPGVYSDPDSVRFDRQPNPHLTFGRGAHACLGVTLARMELDIGLTTLLSVIPNLRVLDDPGCHTWRGSFRSRGVVSLQVGLPKNTQ